MLPCAAWRCAGALSLPVRCVCTFSMRLGCRVQRDLADQSIFASGVSISYQQPPQVQPKAAVDVSLTRDDIAQGVPGAISQAATSAQLPLVLTKLGVSPNVTVNVLQVGSKICLPN